MKKTFLLITAAAFLLIVSFAYAETSRAEYIAKVEPICEKNTKTNEKTLKGVETEVKKGKLKRPTKAFASAAKALKGALGELEAVEEPEADKATLSKWFGYIHKEVGYFEAVSKKLKQGNKNAAEKMVIKLKHNVELANDTVLGFEFHWCKANTAKFA